MYTDQSDQQEFDNFYLPFGGKLDPENRWVKLAALVPWKRAGELYAEALAGTGMGAPAKDARVALGALIIKERLGVSDAETAAQVAENPYLQYFLGLGSFQEEAPFDPSMMVHFRKRLAGAPLEEINLHIVRAGTAREAGKKREDNDKQDRGAPGNNTGETNEELPNVGKLLIDAGCTPADITYPTDLKLLDAARRKTEATIDTLYENLRKDGKWSGKKPRTYRRLARKAYLTGAKAKRPGKKKRRLAAGRQLRYLRRNFAHIDKLLAAGADLRHLDSHTYRSLLVAGTVYDQQLEMWKKGTCRIADRIVSLHQPHVRPIKRGKAGADTEFGAKIAISWISGYTTLDTLSWDAYNECRDLPGQAETYKKIHGHYPESIHADKIYRTRANRAWCKERGIRLSGAYAGRPPADPAARRQRAKQIREDEQSRVPVEGKFGELKRGGTLARIMAKLAGTARAVIQTGVIVANLNRLLRRVMAWLYRTLKWAADRSQARGWGGEQARCAA